METHSERPRELRWYHAAAILFGDWGTSRLYVLGIAFVLAGSSSFFFVMAMGLFMVLVGVAYTVICAHFPDGGGVYSAAKTRSASLGVIGALLLSADYIVTAALSAYEGFRYILPTGTNSRLALYLAIASILAIGVVNFFGLRRVGNIALFVAIMAVVFYIVLGGFCLTSVGSATITLPTRMPGQGWFDFAHIQWGHFVGVILALSGVEAIANMTGVMGRPVPRNSRRAILIVLAEVVVLNLIMAYAMNALPALAEHPTEDLRDHMVKYLALAYVGPWFAFISSIVFGFLLISAANTAIGDMVSIQYLMSRDRELPGKVSTLNRFGMPWMALLTATLAPVAVLSFVGNNLGMLADLYAIGVVGAIAINLLACGTNRKLELRHWERVTLLVVGSIVAVVEITIAVNKPWALLYAGVVLGAGLTARAAARFAKARRKPVVVPALALTGRKLPAGIPRILVPTRGSPELLRFAADYAAKRHGSVMALFVREVALTFRERDKPLAAEQMTMERDREALAILQEADNICKQAGVKLFPMYVVHDSPAEIILDYAATYGVDALVMGVSRRGPVWRTFHGDVMREVMQYLPENIPLIIHS